MNDLRALPSVDQLMQTQQAGELIAVYGRPLTLEAIRSTLAELRMDYKEDNTIPLRPGILSIVHAYLDPGH